MKPRFKLQLDGRRTTLQVATRAEVAPFFLGARAERITKVAAQCGCSIALVYDVLRGRTPARRGAARLVAIHVGLREGSVSMSTRRRELFGIKDGTA